ncbi:MAG: S1 RNA-binding domain-containing protein [Sphingomonadales bacterium]|jgi:predicted RNA-binding protein (virulence factor B family)
MKAVPGKYNRLKINRLVDFGAFLDDGDGGEILMPGKYLPPDAAPDDMVDAFVYYDSDDRIVATTEKPYVQLGEFAALTCKSTTHFGAFMDWGLLKDLLVPVREQNVPMMRGRKYVVYVYFDKVSERLAGTAKISKFLNNTPLPYEEGDAVDLLIWNKTPLGYNAIIGKEHSGIIYSNEVFQPLTTGDKITGYIKHIRPDGKTDLSLQKSGMAHVDDMAERILKTLRENDGYIGLTDNSSPEDIYERFGMSKKAWKKAVGTLYKARKIDITPNGIRLEM